MVNKSVSLFIEKFTSPDGNAIYGECTAEFRFIGPQAVSVEIYWAEDTQSEAFHGGVGLPAPVKAQLLKLAPEYDWIYE